MEANESFYKLLAFLRKIITLKITGLWEWPEIEELRSIDKVVSLYEKIVWMRRHVITTP